MKKFIAIAVLAVLVLAGCDLVAPIFDPIIGTWEVNVLGVHTTYVFNADKTRLETTTILGVGVTTSGTWSADSTTLTRVTSGFADQTDFYSFNSDNSTMTISPTSGGLSLTLERM